MKKLFALFAVVVLAASAAFAASSAEKSVILAGTESTYPPYEFRNPEGKLVGFHIDLVEAIGRVTGKKIEWIDMSFDALIPSLLTHKLDMIGAGFLMTEARRQKVAFTRHYEISRGAVLALNENLDKIKSLDDLTGKVVTAQMGSYVEQVCVAHGGITVRPFKKFDDCLLEVVYGRAYAATMGLVAAKKYIKAKDFAGKVGIAFDYEMEGTENKKGFAIRKDDPEFKALLDKALDEIEASGELKALKEKWGLL
jgi:polar amino acid transport system substrate-binding protein